jgi:hypothetical protein
VIKFTNTSLGGIFEGFISTVAKGTWKILVEDFKKAVSNDFFSAQISLVPTSGVFYTTLRFLVDMFGGFSKGKCHQRLFARFKTLST